MDDTALLIDEAKLVPFELDVVELVLKPRTTVATMPGLYKTRQTKQLSTSLRTLSSRIHLNVCEPMSTHTMFDRR